MDDTLESRKIKSGKNKYGNRYPVDDTQGNLGDPNAIPSKESKQKWAELLNSSKTVRGADETNNSISNKLVVSKEKTKGNGFSKS